MERYEPEHPGSLGEIPQLLEYLQREFRRISLSLAGVLPSQVEIRHVAPTKLREGMIEFADGTNWNPGAGKGIYAYYSGAWNKLG